jgi:hypothetical protein
MDQGVSKESSKEKRLLFYEAEYTSAAIVCQVVDEYNMLYGIQQVR